MGYEIDTKRGVLQHYGARVTNEKFGGQQGTNRSAVKTAVWEFTYEQLPTAGITGLEHQIPANASIVGARFVVDTPFAGGTTYTVGLATKAGVEIDLDGLLTAANLPVASLTPKGNSVVGTGALVGKTVGALPGEVVVTAAGTFTAGKGRVIVDYILTK